MTEPPQPAVRRRIRAIRVRPGVPNAGPAAQAALHHGHHGHLPARVLRPVARGQLPQRPARASATPTPPGGLALINLFSGGALLQLSVFALGIMPYITASIIIQLLTVVIPRFEALKEEGQAGHDEAHAVHPLPDDRSGGPAVDDARRDRAQPGRPLRAAAQRTSSPATASATILLMIITLTAGTGLIMWLGELVTEKGVGNGMSLLIFTSIAAGFPGSLWAITNSNGLDVHAHRHRARPGRHGAGRVRRALPAAHPGPVRQAHGRPADVRRHQHLHPDQGQHRRRHPGHLRQLAALPAGPDRPVPGQQHGRLGDLGQRRT